jgi:hypothetical protein
MKRKASSADLLPAAVPSLFDSVVENNGRRFGEKVAGLNVPLLVWNTHTYSRRFLSASDGETTAVSMVDRGVKSENPFLSVCTGVGIVPLKKSASWVKITTKSTIVGAGAGHMPEKFLPLLWVIHRY